MAKKLDHSAKKREEIRTLKSIKKSSGQQEEEKVALVQRALSLSPFMAFNKMLLLRSCMREHKKNSKRLNI
jgi:hypothetical protein